MALRGGALAAGAPAIVCGFAVPYINRDHRPGSSVLETPCVNICLLDRESGTCIGCGRTLAEIAQWAAMSDAERRAIMAALPARMASLEPAKG